ncbi:MAG TPA: hypothetical protein VGC75_07350, partial [Candidatus Nitrosocosmicus sp.]
NSIINTQEETKLFVGNGENDMGIKLILKPKDNTISSLHIDESHDNSSNFNELSKQVLKKDG